MLKYLFIPILSFLFFSTNVAAQFKHKADSLTILVNQSISDSEKVVSLGNLAAFYYAYLSDRLGDSILQKQLSIAEVSLNKNLLHPVLFGNNISNIISTANKSNWRSKETFNRAIEFIEKGIEYAKALKRDDNIAISYIRLAELYRNMGLLDKAYYNASLGFTTAIGLKNDSIKIVAQIEMGNVYLARGEILLAFKIYTNANDEAENINGITLLSEVYHCYAALYKTLGNFQQAKDYLQRSVVLNTENKQTLGLIKDYIELGRLTSERDFIDKAIYLSDSIQNIKYTIQAKRLLYGYYAYIVANSDSTLQYINRNEELRQVYFLGDTSKYYSVMGSIYHYANRFDSAIIYFKLAEPDITKNFGNTTLQDLYAQLADCYDKTNQPLLAIQYYNKSAELNSQIKDPNNELIYTNALSSLYEKLQNFKEAFRHAQKAILLKDSLQTLSDQKEIAAMEIKNEQKNHDKILEAIARNKIITANLQYMLITIVISLIFLAMILIGMFPVSKFTNKILGYFAFISLFEFVILILDTSLHKIAHGEPLWIWICKIIIVAILAPFHHYLEKGMAKFIESKSLVQLRQKMSFKNWWPMQYDITIPTTTTTVEDESEEDLGIL